MKNQLQLFGSASDARPNSLHTWVHTSYNFAAHLTYDSKNSMNSMQFNQFINKQKQNTHQNQ